MSYAAGIRLVLDLIPENNLPDLDLDPEPSGRKQANPAAWPVRSFS